MSFIPFFPPDLYRKLAEEIVKGDPAARAAIKLAEAKLQAEVNKRAAVLAAKKGGAKVPGWALAVGLLLLLD